MYRPTSMRPLVQTTGIITAIMLLVSGVTFAALQSQQATIKGNSIQTSMADLRLSKDNTNYSNSIDGYSFNGLVPGGAAVPANGNPIYLLNNGNSALAIKLSVADGLSNPNNVDLSKVHVILSPYGGGSGQNVTLQDLQAANKTGGMALTLSGFNHLSAGANTGFTMQIMMDADAVNGSSANIGNLIFNFDAAAVS